MLSPRCSWVILHQGNFVIYIRQNGVKKLSRHTGILFLPPPLSGAVSLAHTVALYARRLRMSNEDTGAERQAASWLCFAVLITSPWHVVLCEVPGWENACKVI